jgi:hypothetical protein
MELNFVTFMSVHCECVALMLVLIFVLGNFVRVCLVIRFYLIVRQMLHLISNKLDKKMKH